MEHPSTAPYTSLEPIIEIPPKPVTNTPQHPMQSKQELALVLQRTESVSTRIDLERSTEKLLAAVPSVAKTLPDFDANVQTKKTDPAQKTATSFSSPKPENQAQRLVYSVDSLLKLQPLSDQVDYTVIATNTLAARAHAPWTSCSETGQSTVSHNSVKSPSQKTNDPVVNVQTVSQAPPVASDRPEILVNIGVMPALENNLERPPLVSEITCFGCTKTFRAYRYILQHLELNQCSSQITSKQLDQWALENSGSGNYVIEGREEFLDIKPGVYVSLDDDFNPQTSHWHCHHARCRFTAVLRRSLDQHLVSDKHRPNPYMCPNPLCREPFMTLSRLIAHVESTDCEEGVWNGTGSIGKLLSYICAKLNTDRDSKADADDALSTSTLLL